MKKSIFLSLALVLIAGSAHAEVLANVSGSSLYRFGVDPAFGKFESQGLTGGVSRDLTNRTLSLGVSFAPVCNGTQYCAQYVRSVIQAEALPIISIKTGTCQETIVVAEKDLRTSDGDLETLTVVDNSTNVCKTLIALPPVEVTYETEGFDRQTGQTVRTHSQFEGAAFEMRYFMHN